MQEIPLFLDVFLAPVRDNSVVQVEIVALLLLILLDIIFGVVNACMKGEFSSSVMRRGIGHKCTELGYVMVGIIADALIFTGVDIGITGPVLGAVLGGLCIVEIGSLMEIFGDMNPDLSKNRLFHMLDSIKPKGDE